MNTNELFHICQEAMEHSLWKTEYETKSLSQNHKFVQVFLFSENFGYSEVRIPIEIFKNSNKEKLTSIFDDAIEYGCHSEFGVYSI